MAIWWHETIRLYCAQADATAIIIACLAGGRPSVPALTLALDCQQEKLTLQPAAEQQLDTFLAQSTENPNLALRQLVTRALLTKRLREMVHLHENVRADRSLVTCAEYQLFLDERRARRGKRMPPVPAKTGIIW